MKKILLASVLCLGLLGCSGWNQDPLKNKDGVLATGKGQPTELVEPKPLSSDAVRVLAPDFFRFKEGESAEFNVLVRNLLPGYTTQVVIDNLADFPNATFDAATGLFKWTPAPGLVAVTEIEKNMTLKLRVIASQTGSATIFSEKQVSVILSRKFNTPKITAISKNIQTMREGDTQGVTINIDDMDADPMDQTTWSNIQILPSLFKRSISGLMKLASYRYISGTTYEAIFTIDLRDAEVTATKDTFSFDVLLNSRFNQISDRQTQNVDVLTSFTVLNTTWTTLLEDKIGAKINYQFLIYDPKGELAVSFVGVKNEIKNSTTKCIQASTSLLSCTFAYDTTAVTAPNVLNFSITTNSKNQNSSDTQIVSKDLNFIVNLTK